MYRFFFLCLLLSTLLLPACSNDVDLPPQREPGFVSGKVVDGVISGARVTVFAFGDGVRGRRLGSSTTDADGNFSLEIRAASQLILIESTGGTYIEQASGTVVTVPGGDVMQAIAWYESGGTVASMVTPLTHLVSGLTSYQVRQGASTIQAFNEAKAAIDQFFTIDTSSAIPIDIMQADVTVNALSEEALYGFYLAGMSNLSLWASNKNQVPPHTTYTSIGVTQIMYNDILADGKLDGMGFDLSRTNLMPLAVGVVPVSGETYRAAFSLHLLAVSNAAGNETALKPGDLQTVAEDLATKSSELFDSADTLDIHSQAPLIDVAQPLQTAYSGTMTLPLDIGGLLDAASISVSVDSNPAGELADPKNPHVVIDTTLYPPDGAHVLRITATDILGNTSSKNITVNFDNTNPVINITSSLVSKASTITLGGTYYDNIAGVDSILVNGQAALLNQDGTWSVSIGIIPGENIVPISVFDFAGNELVTQISVYLDNLAPDIDTSGGHSTARFSNGSGGFFSASLQDTNAANPLYITTDRLALNGVPIVRTQLDSNLIPYFVLTVSDQRTATTPTPFTELRVRIQYEKAGVILSPWRAVPVPSSGNQYLIPLASEMLAPDWHQASPNDIHKLQVEVSDPAGNVTVRSFDFRTDFIVPALNISSMTTRDLNASIFSGTTFANRASLNNMQFTSTEFTTITNPVDTAIYIQPGDSGTHTVRQIVEQLAREHQVRMITTTEWRLRLMSPNLKCPDQNAADWQTVTSVFNRVNGDWQEESVPAPASGPIEFAPSDNLPVAPAASIWGNTPQFDNEFSTSSTTNNSLTLSYNYDYVLDPFNFTPPAAQISNWVIRNAGGNVVDSCADANFFQQRETYVYQSEPGFPQTVIRDETIDNTPVFATTGFEVVDMETNSIIQAVSGWYPVPAGHSVAVAKKVTTPQLLNYNDDISDPASATYTPIFNDRSITWSVNREINISVIHNTGEANIAVMSPQNNAIGSGIMNYQISR